MILSLKSKILNSNNKKIKIISSFVKKLSDDDIFGLTAELTFYLTMSFFPFMILLLALISITPLSLEETLFSLLSNLSKEIYDIVYYILTGVERSTTIIITSGVVAIWSISRAIATINKALNRMYETDESRSFIIIRVIGFVFAILLALIIILTFFLLIMGNLIGVAILKFFPSFNILWHTLRLIMICVIILIFLSIIYKVLPNKSLKFNSVKYGAVFTSVLWVGSSTSFSFYIDNFANYHILYGSLAGIVVLITWLYICSIMLLLGGEINSIIYLKNTPISR